ncbi:hypothetical protein [Aeromonas sp. R10-1]|uniref:hypothetical protein n=1 Tax=Aeromonas sp. R10-1 TaxID=3138457 RepID=UPI0034A3525B
MKSKFILSFLFITFIPMAYATKESEEFMSAKYEWDNCGDASSDQCIDAFQRYQAASNALSHSVLTKMQDANERALQAQVDDKLQQILVSENIKVSQVTEKPNGDSINQPDHGETGKSDRDSITTVDKSTEKDNVDRVVKGGSDPALVLTHEIQGRLFDLFGDEGEFIYFDSDLRKALESSSLDQLSTMIKYPLRITGTEWGAIAITNPNSLRDNYSRIFTKEVVNAILKTNPNGIVSSSDGIHYSDGNNSNASVGVIALYVDKKLAYKIGSINLPLTAERKHSKDETGITYQCETKKHMILIDSMPNNLYRYRSWNKPRKITEKPDVEIKDPKAWRPQGTGACSYTLWDFSRGNISYQIDEGSPCGEQSIPDKKGSVRVYIGGAEKLSLPCL